MVVAPFALIPIITYDDTPVSILSSQNVIYEMKR